MIAALQSGDALSIREAFNPFLESLVQSTPYIFGGLAVALGFRAGLFNIGVEGQLFIGAACATYVGYAVTGLPPFIHMPLAFLAGALGGALWGFVPGILKATTGGHEVINTIMMNWIAFRFTEWLLSGPMTRPGSGGMPISPLIQKSAQIPQFFQSPIRFHLGFFIALAVAWLVWWLLFKTTLGLNLRTRGNQSTSGKICRLERRHDDRCRHGDVRCPGWYGRCKSDPGTQSQYGAWAFIRLRLRQYRTALCWETTIPWVLFWLRSCLAPCAMVLQK